MSFHDLCVPSCYDAVSSVSPVTYVKAIGAVSAAMFIGEFAGRKYKVVYRPSFFMKKAASGCINFYTKAGKAFAWVGSYLTEIDLKEVTETAVALGKPTFDLVKSPFYTFVGYAEKAASYGNKEWMIYIGSSLLVAVLGYAWYYISGRYSWMNVWTPARYFINKRLSL